MSRGHSVADVPDCTRPLTDVRYVFRATGIQPFDDLAVVTSATRSVSLTCTAVAKGLLLIARAARALL